MADEVKEAAQPVSTANTGPILALSGQNLTPIFANQVHVITSPEMLRLTFGESLLGVEGIRFHTALAIPLSMARSMSDLILQMIARQDEQMKQLEEQSTA
jgi:hypothetical protein